MELIERIDDFYEKYSSLTVGTKASSELIEKLKKHHKAIKAEIKNYGVKEKFLKIYESTSGAAYNIRFFDSEERSVAVSLKNRNRSVYDSKSIAFFDMEIVWTCAQLKHLELLFNYAIDDLSEELLHK